jgi:cation diffusion facilitator CzcD-associated flavoprotein CzcO
MMSTATNSLRNPSIAIIGAGMTGINWAIRLQKAGIKDVTILEKKSDIGGTWRENTYPGVACDVPAHMYTFKSEPNPNWSKRFAEGKEIFAYLKTVTNKYGIANKVRFNEEVTESNYDNGKWRITTSKAQQLVVDFVINCTGILHKPAFPDINGLNDFKGNLFHTAQWDHSVELKGKRIGVIGTGSTAAQAIPELINTDSTQVSVFQRTAQWIIPIPNKVYSEKEKARLNNSALWRKLTYKTFTTIFDNIFSRAVIGQKLQLWWVDRLARKNLKTSIKDPILREKLTPNYKPGCKRMIMNTDFYPSIQQPNAKLITDGIERVTEEGIVTTDGKHHKLDIIVLGTGFDPFAFMRPMSMKGKNGIDINEVWSKKITAYRSLMIPGFPNFFLMLGPNTPIGNNSVIRMSEAQTDYLMQILDKWRREEFDTVEPKQSAVEAFMAHIKKGMPKTIWVTGCKSWYLDADGDPALWPYTFGQWLKEMKKPEYKDLILQKTEDKTETIMDTAFV